MDLIATLTMNPALDIAAEIEELVPGKKLRSKSRHYAAGGGGINVARAVHRDGGQVRAVFPAGGGSGETLVSLLEEREVPIRAVPIEGSLRENFAVRVRATGELFHFVMPGPKLSEAEAQRCLDALQQIEPAPRYLVASGSLPPGVDTEFYARVARLARQQNARLILDTSGEALHAALQEPVFLIKPNRDEFSDLAGEPLATDTKQRVQQLARVVQERRLSALVVTLGNEGALLCAENENVWAQPPAVETDNPVGAGDSFVAQLVHKLATGASLAEALGYGVAGAAAAVVERDSDLYRQEDVERFHQQMLDEHKIQTLAR